MSGKTKQIVLMYVSLLDIGNSSEVNQLKKINLNYFVPLLKPSFN